MDAEMEAEAYSDLSAIQNFYFGRSIFVTGVTGFVGKVLVEKLLRCCPGIGMIYLMMRPKYGKTSEDRLEKLFKADLFTKLKEVYPSFRKKICLIDGDLEEKRLGISDHDFEKIREHVSVVFHSAARVQFNDPLRIAVQHNVVGTRHFVEMCHDLPGLASVVHVSTSYIFREEDGSVLERIPRLKVTPQQIMDAMQWMDDKSAQAAEDQILGGKQTTYLVTKALGERVVDEGHGDLPTAIVRPCNISPTWKDPFPGWVDSIQGISGLLLAGAKGVLRTLMTIDGLKLNLIPVDLVANAMIASGWHVGITRPSSVFILNCVINDEKLPYADQDVLDVVLKKRTEYPLANIYRYPDFKMYYSKTPYIIHSIIDEWIPAYILDFFLYLFTGKTILVRVYKKISFLYGIFLRLGSVPWICRLENYNILQESLSETDAEIFYMNADSLNWEDYMDNCLKGGRKYLAHEDPSNIPYAKTKSKIWLTVTTILKWCVIFFLFYILVPRTLSMFNGDDRLYTISS